MVKQTHKKSASETPKHALPDSVFQNLFESIPGLYLILLPDPHFTIVAVSDAYLKATNTARPKILGRPLFEIFPDNPDDPNATGVKNLTHSLNNVLAKKKPDTMAVQKYDIPLKQDGKKNGKKKFEVRYWSPLNSPVMGRHGKVAYIIHSVIDVTEFVEMEHIQQKQLKAADQLEKQNRLFRAEIEQTTKELEEHQKNEQELREIDELKSDFIKIASHQLRTPLTSIKWSSDELLNRWDAFTREKQESYIRQIHDSNERMIALIHDLLDVTKIDTGDFETSSELMWLQPILDQVLEDMAALIEKKRVKINRNIDPNLPVMFFDPVWIRLLFQNLLTNAVTYSPPESEITVSVASKGKFVEISVADHGCGIPKNQQSKVFDKFFRADNAKEISSDGTGVGLYITKSIVEGAGGSLWFKSVQNKGSTFYAKIPIRYKKK